MNRLKRFAIDAVLVVGALALAGCGGASEPVETAEVTIETKPPSVSFKPASDVMVTQKPSGPVTIGYRIVGKPVVGQPVAIDLRINSMYGSVPVSVSYRINDVSAMRVTDAQPRQVMVSPVAEEPFMTEQVSVIPLREGRLYLNVSASVPTENGTYSTVTAIPIQVGEGTRTLVPNGELESDEDGNSIRVLPGSE